MAHIEIKEASGVNGAELLNVASATVIANGTFCTTDANGKAIAATDTATGNVSFAKVGSKAGETQLGVISDARTVYLVDTDANLTLTDQGVECGFTAAGLVDPSNTTDKLVKICTSLEQESHVGSTKALVKIIATL